VAENAEEPLLGAALLRFLEFVHLWVRAVGRGSTSWVRAVRCGCTSWVRAVRCGCTSWVWAVGRVAQRFALGYFL